MVKSRNDNFMQMSNFCLWSPLLDERKCFERKIESFLQSSIFEEKKGDEEKSVHNFVCSFLFCILFTNPRKFLKITFYRVFQLFALLFIRCKINTKVFPFVYFSRIFYTSFTTFLFYYFSTYLSLFYSFLCFSPGITTKIFYTANDKREKKNINRSSLAQLLYKIKFYKVLVHKRVDFNEFAEKIYNF